MARPNNWPILERVGLYAKNHGGIRFLDWNLVSTKLGAMIEPRNLSPVPIEDQGDIADFDQEINEFDAIREIDENKFFSYYQHGGSQTTFAVRQ